MHAFGTEFRTKQNNKFAQKKQRKKMKFLPQAEFQVFPRDVLVLLLSRAVLLAHKLIRESFWNTTAKQSHTVHILLNNINNLYF